MLLKFKKNKNKTKKSNICNDENQYILNKDDDFKLKNLSKNARKILDSVPPNKIKKILYLPSYYQSNFTRVIDSTLILALQIRGAEVIPVLSNLFFKNEDVIYGGIYGNNDRFKNTFNYSNIENNLLTNLLNTSPISLTSFSNLNDHFEAEEIANLNKYDNLIYKEIDISEMAKKAVANMNNLPSMPIEKKYTDQYYWHIYNIVKLYKSYERIINIIKPDVIVSNCPFYYKWQIPYHLALKNKISFYSYMLGERENTIFWSLNSLKIFDSSQSWSSFKKTINFKTYEKLIDEAINKRKNGKISYIDFAPKYNQSSTKIDKIKEKINNRATVIFPSNILVDAIALQKTLAFDSCLDMIKESVKFFKQNPQFVCILKAHPGEKIFLKSGTDTSSLHLKNVLIKNCINLPENVIFIDYDDEISSFDLFSLVCGMITYSSSTAMEISWFGKKIISAHSSHYSVSGISHTPKNVEDFLDELIKILNNNKINLEQIENGKKYYLLYYFFGLIDLKLFQGNDIDSIPSKLLFNDIDDLSIGKNKTLDYICDSILNNKPIFGENRWPPISN